MKSDFRNTLSMARYRATNVEIGDFGEKSQLWACRRPENTPP